MWQRNTRYDGISKTIDGICKSIRKAETRNSYPLWCLGTWNNNHHWRGWSWTSFLCVCILQRFCQGLLFTPPPLESIKIRSQSFPPIFLLSMCAYFAKLLLRSSFHTTTAWKLLKYVPWASSYLPISLPTMCVCILRGICQALFSRHPSIKTWKRFWRNTKTGSCGFQSIMNSPNYIGVSLRDNISVEYRERKNSHIRKLCFLEGELKSSKPPGSALELICYGNFG